MKLSEMFPRKYAVGEDLNGKAHTLIISGIKTEQMHPAPGQPAVDKYVLYFKGAVKGVILSRTLAEQIAVILKSEDTDKWIGKKITLFTQPMKVAGKDRIAIRARQPDNGETPPPPSLQRDDEIDEIL